MSAMGAMGAIKTIDERRKDARKNIPAALREKPMVFKKKPSTLKQTFTSPSEKPAASQKKTVAPQVASATSTMSAAYAETGFSLFHGDCLKIMAEMPAETVDMIFADPPYRLSNNGVTCHAGKRVSVNKGDWDRSQGVSEDLLFHENWIQACRKLLKPNGTIWISGTSHSIYQCGFLLQKCGFHILNDIAWSKPNAPPNLACRTFTHSHETLLWAVKEKGQKYTFNYSAMKSGDFPEDILKRPGKQMRSIWSILPPPSREKELGKHPTQKPISLLERIILASTKGGDTVLDPFNGSGTTGLACVIVGGRQYFGIELDEDYITLTVERLKKVDRIK